VPIHNADYWQQAINPLMPTLKLHNIGQQYSDCDWYTGLWWVGCYIWYREKPGGLGPTHQRPVCHLLIWCGTI